MKSKFQMAVTIFIFCILLYSCSPRTSSPSMIPAQTDTPTSPVTSPGSGNPTAIAVPSEIPSPTPKPDVTASFGLSSEFSAKLKAEGIANTISGEKGSWQVGQVISGWNKDGTPVIENNVQIVSIVDYSVHNEDYPDGILKGTDSQGKTVFWSEEEKSWVRPFENSTEFEKPTFYPDGKQYLVIESALLNPNLNKPFDDDAVKNYQGWSIDFEYDASTKTSHAYLRPRDSRSIRWALDENGKPSFYYTVDSNGNTFESTLIQLLNPADPKNPKADETLFSLATMGEWWNPAKQGVVSLDQRKIFLMDYLNNVIKNNKPQIELAQRGGWFAQHHWDVFGFRPSLDSLLSGNNSPEKVTQLLGYFLKSNLDGEPGSLGLSPKNPLVELENFIIIPLDKEIQQALAALSFSVK